MKSNKGITLIALVVTIIILLILAGVSITAISGDGLFGRASSASEKYQAASEAENSTISSILDKYDYYESKTQGIVTVSWTAPIAERGSFINSLSPAEYVNSNFYDKQVVAVKPNGEKQLLNPYQAANVSVPTGTKLRFYYYRDKTAEKTAMVIGEMPGFGTINQRRDADKDGKLCYVEMTVTSDEVFSLYGDENREVMEKPGAEPAMTSFWIVVVNRNSGEVRIKWNAAIASQGSFINSLSPAEYKNSNYFDKQIVLTKPDGTKTILNPYQPVNVSAPVGSTLDFYYYRTKEADGTMFLGPNEHGPMDYLDIIDTAKDGKLVISKCVVTSGMTFEFGYDAIDENVKEEISEYEGDTLYVWSIPAEYDYNNGDAGEEQKSE